MILKLIKKPKLNFSSIILNKGIYKDNYKNQKLGRVGQHYGNEKDETSHNNINDKNQPHTSFKIDTSKTTAEQFQYKDGSWNKERVEKVHKPIIEKYVAQVKSHEHPVVTLMMGAPASGKGSVRESIQDTYDFGDVIIDPDNIKMVDLKDDWDTYSKADPESAANNIHAESSHLGKEIQKALIDKKANFTLDKTFCNYNSLESTIKEFIQNGYKINIIYASLPKEVAHERMLARGKRTGRYIPEGTFNNKHDNIVKTFDKLTKEYGGKLNNIYKYDTNVEKDEKPKLVLNIKKEKQNN